MRQELPGFYYDAEKNRYFPVKGPIPGSRNPPTSNTQQENDQQSSCNRKGIGTCKLLEVRELCGRVLSYNRLTCNFKNEFQQMQASQSKVWKYESMDGIVDSSLEHFVADMQTPEGQTRTDLLLMGSMRGSLSLYEVGEVGKHFDYGVKRVPKLIWPLNTNMRDECTTTATQIWRPKVPVVMPTISCIKRNGNHSRTADGSSTIQHALITTLGSETSGGTVYVMDLNDPLDFSLRRISEVDRLGCTIWTADCNPNRSEAVIGTNLGARLVNLETRSASWLCRSKSDVLSLQFDQSGNVVLCGYRNGVIETVDVRQKHQGFLAELPGQRAPNVSHIGDRPPTRNARHLSKKRLKGNITTTTVCMPSSISSLVSLETYDQYFLASSMDGSIKLYDHRLIHRGPVQSYEGQVNTHTRIQLGVDPSKKFMISGGEDGKVRIWSIKSGELLFAAKISSSVPTSVCWPSTESEPIGCRNNLYEKNHLCGAWLGSAEGLFYVQAS